MAETDPESSHDSLFSRLSPKNLLARGLDESPPPAPAADSVNRRRSGVIEDSLAALFPELIFRKVISRGGSGVVYRAEHRKLKRSVAVKILSAALTQRVQTVARFEREIQIVGKLDHPGIVRAFDAGQRGGIWFLTMEYVHGVDFGALAKAKGHLEPADACELICEAALALQHAHENGLVHRDVKPANLMLSTYKGRPVVKVLDFGLACLTQDGNPGGDLTLSGEFLGTVDYVAPEQIEDPRGVDPRADVYSLGATLYRLLSGQSPHGGNDGATTLYSKLLRIAQEPAPGIAARCPGLPPGLAEVVDRMVAHKLTDRFASTAEAAAALGPFTTGADLSRLLQQLEIKNPAAEELPGEMASPMTSASRKSEQKPRSILLFGAAILLFILLGLGLGFRSFILKNSSGANPSVSLPSAKIERPFEQIPPEVTIRQSLTPETTPRILSREWKFEQSYKLGSPRAAHFHPITETLYFCAGRAFPNSLNSMDPSGRYKNILTNISAYLGVVAPDGDTLVWADQRQGALGIGQLKSRSIVPAINYAGTMSGAVPIGIAFPPRKWRGASNFGPRSGVVVDAGTNGTRGLWNFNLDSGKSERLAANSELPDAPVDATFSEQDIFVINRTNGNSKTGPVATDLAQRIFRVAKDRLVGCHTDLPLVDPCGIAWDPVAEDLYVLDGGQSYGVLRLHPLEQPDQFHVEKVISGFQTPTNAGIDISSDGSHLVVTDPRADKMVIIWVFVRAY